MRNQGLQIHETADGSPTLSFGPGEWMHHPVGALTESALIYGEVIEKALEVGLAPHFLSVGLGLGYVEMWVAACCPGPFTLSSFESSEAVVTQWRAWLDHEDPPIRAALEKAARGVEARFGLGQDVLRTRLRDARERGWWQTRGALETAPIPPWSVALFDPFCSKTSPELWSAALLDRVLSQAQDRAAFSTYAAVGTLNRALERQGFNRIPRRGMGKKRESTLAIRGLESPPWQTLSRVVAKRGEHGGRSSSA